MFEWIFAFLHLILVIGVAVYALIALFTGNYMRFSLIAACLAVYYLLVLHKPVKNEIKRKKAKKN